PWRRLRRMPAEGTQPCGERYGIEEEGSRADQVPMAPVYRERGQRLTPGGQAILCHLADHPLDFRKEIRHSLRMPNGTFQYHLQVLEECGLLRPVRYRGKTYYRILIRGAPRVAMFLERLGW